MDFSKYAHEFEKQMDEIILAMPKIELKTMIKNHSVPEFYLSIDYLLDQEYDKTAQYLFLTPKMKAKFVKTLTEEERYVLDLCALYSLQKASLLFKSLDTLFLRLPTSYRSCAAISTKIPIECTSFRAFDDVIEKLVEKYDDEEY